MLGQIGWQSEVIEGGYQTFRRLVHQAMYTTPIAQKIVLLDGNTGTAKTDIIQELKKIDVQTIDLEGLAGHRGSLLGEMPGGQPSQKAFESRIALSLAQMDPNRPVIVEAESNKIGARIIPPTLWDAMNAAPRIGISASIETRTTYLTRAYDDILSDQERLRDRLSPLIAHRGHELVNGWYTLLNSGDKFGLTKALMEQHYDPSYAKSRNAIGAHFIAEISVEKLDQAGISDAAIAVKSAISKLSSS
jgi:tRNA 2-selenouridine synthase